MKIKDANKELILAAEAVGYVEIGGIPDQQSAKPIVLFDSSQLARLERAVGGTLTVRQYQIALKTTNEFLAKNGQVK